MWPFFQKNIIKCCENQFLFVSKFEKKLADHKATHFKFRTEKKLNCRLKWNDFFSSAWILTLGLCHKIYCYDLPFKYTKVFKNVKQWVDKIYALKIYKQTYVPFRNNWSFCLTHKKEKNFNESNEWRTFQIPVQQRNDRIH